ncbi:hypothetical protein [Bradyrhizobium japonicum]|uniref:hypothetical protein n=1 Tax=Bradyrhizobium japonicum TaxID=375 RepID=UPI000429C2F0|nr:hypothetical protein [Bradyrhizobium japonicum]
MPTKFAKIREAFEFANTSGDMGIFRAYVCRQSGETYYWADEMYSEPLDELPDDIEDATKYVRLPDKRDLDLGKPLVLAFVREFLPGDFDDVRYFINKRGGYSKFKALLARGRAIERWHAFENEATEQALREWCKEEEISIEG